MSMLLCLIRPGGEPITEDDCRRYDRKREAQTRTPARWCLSGEFAALIGSDVDGVAPNVVQVGEWTAVGIVRLYSGNDVPDAPRAMAVDVSGLERLVCAIDRRGPAAVGDALGEFSFVAWNRTRREIVAARDTFGRWRLYIVSTPTFIAISSRASLLAESETYDLEFIAEYLVNGQDTSGRTAFLGVEALRPAEVWHFADGRSRRIRYWSVLSHVPQDRPWELSQRDTVERFRVLLFNAVKRALTGTPDVWSQLSGGMDSSSVVAIAATLASTGQVPHGVTGVVTYGVTPLVGGDAEYAGLVSRHCGVEQRLLTDWWGWQDDEYGPPLLDQPGGLAVYALTRRVTRLVHDAGGRVLLSGLGADLYLRPHFAAAADDIARGNIRQGLLAVTQWAGAMRTSFWRLAFTHGIYPLLPPAARQRLAQPEWRVPEWIAPDFARAYELRGRTPATRLYAGPRGRKVWAALNARLLAEDDFMYREMIGEENLEWRYPFLDRPLVEYALRLPPEWQFGNGLSKRVLREAMKDLLPDQVRLRRGKGGLRPEHQLALRRGRGRLEAMLRDPILAELGCMVPGRLVQTMVAPRHGSHAMTLSIHHTLSLELWLRRRQERWP